MSNKWIPVDKELPQGRWSLNHQYLSEEVLIANSCAVCIGFYNRQNGNWYTGAPIEENWIDKVTHWMSLPENPHNKPISKVL